MTNTIAEYIQFIMRNTAVTDNQKIFDLQMLSDRIHVAMYKQHSPDPAEVQKCGEALSRIRRHIDKIKEDKFYEFL